VLVKSVEDCSGAVSTTWVARPDDRLASNMSVEVLLRRVLGTSQDPDSAVLLGARANGASKAGPSGPSSAARCLESKEWCAFVEKFDANPSVECVDFYTLDVAVPASSEASGVTDVCQLPRDQAIFARARGSTFPPFWVTRWRIAPAATAAPSRSTQYPPGRAVGRTQCLCHPVACRALRWCSIIETRPLAQRRLSQDRSPAPSRCHPESS
jgi:hypothetical protein